MNLLLAAMILLIIFIFIIVFRPLFQQVLLKLKHKDHVQTLFFPIIGVFKSFNDGLANHNDIIFYKRHLVATHPQMKVIVSNIFITNFYQFTCPTLCKQILQNPHLYAKRKTDFCRDIFGCRGLVFTEGQLWKSQKKNSQRNLLSSYFTFAAIQSRIPVIKQCVEFSMQRIPTNQQIHIIQLLSKVAGEVVARSFFSKDFTAITVNGKPFVTEMQHLAGDLIGITYGSIWHQFRSAAGYFESTMPKILLTKSEKELIARLNEVRRIALEIIDERIEKYEQNEKEANHDFLQVLLEEMIERKGMVREDILHQFLIFLFAGTDTTSNFAGMAIYMLAKHPEIQQQLKNELKEFKIVFSELENKQIQQLKLLNAFIQECLRLVLPTDGLIPRQATQDHYVGQYFLKKGTYVDVCIQPLATHPTYFKDPLKMDLTRWLADDSQINQQFTFIPKFFSSAFIPFSGGPRNCIGQHMALLETKMILIYILQHYKVKPDPKTQLVMKYGFLYEPADDRLVILEDES